MSGECPPILGISKGRDGLGKEGAEASAQCVGCVQVLEYSGTCKRSHAFIPEGRESLRFVSPTGSWSGKEQRESGIVGIRGS